MSVAPATERKKQDERRVHLLAMLNPFYGKITKLLHSNASIIIFLLRTSLYMH